MINLIRFLFRSSGSIVILPIVAGAAGGAMGIALIALIQHELASDAPAPGIVIWGFFGLCLASAATRAISQIAIVRMGQEAIARLSLQVVRSALVLPLRAFENLDSSALLSALTDDIALIANAMVGLPHLCINIPVVVACLAYTGWLAPRSVACGIVFAALGIVAFTIVSTRGMKALRRARELQASLMGQFRTLVGGFRELKLHRGRRHAFFDELLEPTMSASRKEMVRGFAHFAVAEGWGQVAFFGFIGFLLFAAPQIETMSRSTLVSAVLVVLYLMTPLDTILTWVPVLGRAHVSLQRIQTLIPTLASHGDPDDARRAPAPSLAFREAVTLEGVTFTYHDQLDDSSFSLGPIELTLRAGEIVVLAGGNGTGKTTLVKLITGLYAPDRGSVQVDGRDVSNDDREAYRQLFSVIFADGYLFPDFLGLGVHATETNAQAGLERLGLTHQVTIQDSAFSTLELSQGQRRRLALLGAWLEDRPICVFDEWAANQDPSFKHFFYHELLPELRAAGKAILVISHDENHFDIADRLIHLRDGRLVDESPVRVGDDWAERNGKGIVL